VDTGIKGGFLGQPAPPDPKRPTDRVKRFLVGQVGFAALGLTAEQASGLIDGIVRLSELASSGPMVALPSWWLYDGAPAQPTFGVPAAVNDAIASGYWHMC
jgi:hypothetical protein